MMIMITITIWCMNTCALIWMDSKPVFLLTTAYNPIDPNATAGRWVGRNRVEFPTSPVLLQYQMFMWDVDIVDQQRQEYSVLLQSHKWWHKVFLFILDSWILNCYILYAEDTWAVGLAERTRQLFHYNLGMSCITPLLQPSRIAGPCEPPSLYLVL
jgi:hypothetical protein